MNWKGLFAQEPPDRVERLLSSCRSYYLAGDRDIAALLLREIEKELVKAPLFAHEAAPGAATSTF